MTFTLAIFATRVYCPLFCRLPLRHMHILLFADRHRMRGILQFASGELAYTAHAVHTRSAPAVPRYTHTRTRTATCGWCFGSRSCVAPSAVHRLYRRALPSAPRYARKYIPPATTPATAGIRRHSCKLPIHDAREISAMQKGYNRRIKKHAVRTAHARHVL